MGSIYGLYQLGPVTLAACTGRAYHSDRGILLQAFLELSHNLHHRLGNPGILGAHVVAGGRVFAEQKPLPAPDEIEPDEDSSDAQPKN